MSLPNTYPPQPLAKVHISWAVISVIDIRKLAYTLSGGNQMADAEAKYITYQTITEPFLLDTDLTNYVTDVPISASTVYDYFIRQIPIATTLEIHWSATIKNPTAPPVSMGAWPQAKQHMDGHLTQENVKSVDDISHPILEFLPFMQKIAKY